MKRTFLMAAAGAAAFLCLSPWPARAADSLIPNGGMEDDADADAWPDGWPRLPGNSSWETEEGNRFLRVKAAAPGQMLALFRQVAVPSEAKALELSFRIRCTDLKAGKEPWYDARIIMDFKDASGAKIQPSPSAPYVRGSTQGWIERRTLFLVPEGAAILDFMPALFQVQSGTMDLDDVVLKPVSLSEVLAAEAKAREKAPPADPAPEAPDPAKWPKEIKVSGNRLKDPDGQEVWLQGVNVASLEWNPKGESVLNSIKVATEQWKAKAIRLPVKPDYWLGTGPEDPAARAYRALVDAAITQAANRGAYVILDNHGYRAVRDLDMAFWKDAAARYKNHPAVLFDMINEPHTLSWEVWRNGGFVEERKTKADEDAFTHEDELKKAREGFESPGMQKLLEAIRATGARNVVVAGALDWAYDNTGILKGFALEDKTGNGVMYAAHIYPWKSGWQEKVLDIAAVHPILVGEVGASNKKMDWLPPERQEDPATWVPDMLGTIQKYRLNWTGWCFHPGAGPPLLQDWKYTPTPEWGVPAKEALSGRMFEAKKLR
jgi:hypothetical protein